MAAAIRGAGSLGTGADAAICGAGGATGAASGIGARRQEGRPPVAILRLDQLGMARRADRMRAVRIEIALGQDRIAGKGHERPPQRLGAKDDLRMVDAGPALSGRQIIPAILLEDMRPPDPDGLLRQIDDAIDQLRALADHLAGAPVIFLDPDGAVAIIARRLGGGAAVDDIGAVAPPIDGGIDPLEGQPDRVGPGARRVLGGDDEIAPALDAGVDEVEGAVVIADIGREHRLRDRATAEVELPRPVDRVADLGPVHEIGRVEDRQARKMGEGRVDEIIVLADPRDRRIGIIARDDRVPDIGRCPI